MQTNYDINQSGGMLGMLADSRVKHTEAMIASTALTVGMGVVKVAGKDDQVKAPTLTTEKLFGLVQGSAALEGGLPGESGPAIYPQNDVANILRQGAMYAWFETDFDPDTDTLYMRFAGEDKANGKYLGAFRKDADTSNAVAVTGNIEVRSTVPAQGIGIIVINKPA